MSAAVGARGGDGDEGWTDWGGGGGGGGGGRASFVGVDMLGRSRTSPPSNLVDGTSPAVEAAAGCAVDQIGRR
jgi:hypothetical protein